MVFILHPDVRTSHGHIFLIVLMTSYILTSLQLLFLKMKFWNYCLYLNNIFFPRHYHMSKSFIRYSVLFLSIKLITDNNFRTFILKSMEISTEKLKSKKKLQFHHGTKSLPFHHILYNFLSQLITTPFRHYFI